MIVTHTLPSSPLESFHAQLDMNIRLRQPGGLWESPQDMRYSCNEALVKAHGKFYAPAGERPYAPIPKACYGHAYERTRRKSSKWTYVEGYALSPRTGIVVSHAWITDASAPQRIAYDLAWEGDLSEAIYLGIPFKREYVRKVHVASKRKMYSVLDAYWLHYPLLTGEHDIAEVMA